MARHASPQYATNRARAVGLLAPHGIPSEDARTAVFAVLLRSPDSPVAYIELRAEAHPLSGLAVDDALGWLTGNGYVRLRELPLYGIAYQPTSHGNAPAVDDSCEQRLQRVG